MDISIDIEKVKQGDPVAFRYFFIFFYPKLMALACRFLDKQTVKGLMKKAFIVYWEQKRSVQVDKIGSYLYKCVQNKCLNYLKRCMLKEEYEASLQIAERMNVSLQTVEGYVRQAGLLLRKDLRGILSLLIFLLTILFSITYTVSPVYLILGAGVAGLLLF